MIMRLLIVVIALQLLIAGEVALTQDFPTPHDAMCQVIDWLPFISACEEE